MEFGLNGGGLLNGPGAFQHRFLILIFPRNYGTGTPFLAERAEARQDFFSFFSFFFAPGSRLGIFPRLIALENAPAFGDEGDEESYPRKTRKPW